VKRLPFALCASSEDGTVTGVPVGGVGSHQPSPHKGRVAFPQPSPRRKNDVIDRTKFAVFMATSVHGTHREGMRVNERSKMVVAGKHIASRST
jgi:hypothetical protein